MMAILTTVLPPPIVTILGRTALAIRFGLSTELEACWEPTSSSAPTTTREAGATAATELTTAVHHAEEDLGIDATHAAHAAHTTHASTREHIGGIDQVLATVVTSSLPVE
jgi:hypothetical protein